MLGKYALANNVRTTLNTAINTVATTLVVNVATGIYKNPPNPAGGLGILTLIDSLTQPTKTEIVTYTGFTNNGDGTLTLSGVSRGAEGTVGQSFSAGAIVFQGMTAGQLDTPLLKVSEDDGVVNVVGEIDVDAAVVLQRPDLFTSVMTPQWAFNTDGNYNLTVQNLSNSTSPLKIERSTGNATVAGTVTSSGLAVGKGPPTAVIAGADLAIAGVNGYATIAKFASNTTGAFLGLAKARGTAASPAIIASTDVIGVLSAYSARTSTTWAQSAAISFEADGTQTTTSAPARIVFTTCAVGSTNPTEVLRLNADNSANFVGAVNVGPKPTNPPIAGALAAVSGTNGLAVGSIVRTSADTAGAVLALGKGRGTPTAQAIVVNGDTIGRIDAYAARTSAAWSNVASITFETDGTQTTTSMPTRVVFRTTPSGAIVQAEAARINANGSFTFQGQININGATPVANVPINVVQSTATEPAFQGVAAGSTGTVKIGVNSADQAYIEGAGVVRVMAAGQGLLNVVNSGGSGVLVVNPTSSIDFGTAPLDVNGGRMRLRTSQPPASATAAGSAGTIAWDANYIYVCTATNTWKRSPLSTW